MKNLKAMSKRSLALFLAFIMCVSMMQLSVFAAEPEDTTDTSVSETTDVNTDTETDADVDADTDTDTDVDNTDVDNTDMEDTDVEDTDVEDTDVEDTDVEDTDVEDTDVEDTDVEDTDVEDTDVEDTDVDNTDVDDTNVDDTNVDDTNVEDTNVEDTNVEDTNADDTGVNTPDAGSANPPATDTPVVDTPAVEPPVVNTPPAVEPPAVSTLPAPKAPTVEEIPAEVRAFLKAVAKIPGDINVDNAEKVAELVYGEVSEAYEALLGTEYEDRADVQKAVEAYAAAIEAVDAALELASELFSEAQLPYECSDGVTKSAFENAYNLGQSDTCYGIVKLNGKDEYDQGTPNVWATGGWSGSVNVTGYNWVHITNSNPSVATVTYRYDGGKLIITFTPGKSSGTTKISVGVDAKYPHYSLGTWNMELNFDYTVTNGNSSATGTQLGKATRSVTYDLGSDKAVWGKNPYDGQYGERSSIGVGIINDVTLRDYYYTYYYSFYAQEMLDIAVGSYDTSIATVEAYELNSTGQEMDDVGNTTMKGVGIKVTGLKAGETTVVVTPKFKVPTTSNGQSAYMITRTMPITVYIKVTGEKANTNYELTYNANGGAFGTGEQALETVTQKQSSPEFTVMTQEPTLSGYTFLGWADEDDATTAKYKAGDKITLTKEISPKTIYAVWQKVAPVLKDLTVSKTPSEEYPVVGEEFTYTITVKNPNSTAIIVKITDMLNEKLDVVWDEEYEMYGISDGGTYDEETRTVTWNDVEVPANGDKTVTITVKANAAGEIYNEAKIECEVNETSGNTTVTAKDPDPITRTFKVIYYNESGELWMSVEDSAKKGFFDMPEWQMDVGVTENPHDMTVSTNVPTRDGYTFDHWQWGGDVNATFAPGDTITLTADPETLTEVAADLYAIWTKNPDKYTVTYSWTGLPPESGPAKPTGGSYTEGTEVEVDTQFGSGSTASVGGKTYVFSGWTVPSDVTVTGGKFDMPAKDVVITGTWTEQQYTVTYTWTDLPEGAATLPTGGSYTQGAEVTVDTRFAEGTEVEFDGKTYVFSGWSTGDATIEGGKFTMPGNDVTITGKWTEKTETPPIVPPVVTYSVTYRWTGLPEGAAALPAGGSYAEGAWVTVNASFSQGTTVTVNGTTYEFSGWDRGSFTMPAADVIIRGSWTAVRTTYTVAHEYYTDGTLDTRNESTYTGEVGSAVDPAAIDRISNGYRFTSVNPGTVQTLTENGNLTITLRYDRTTGGGGGGGGGTDDPDPDPTPNPDQPTPDVPVADIPDPDVPLVETPEEDVPLEEIPEENVPLNEFPETPVEEEIPDPEVPLADVPRTGDSLGLWLALSLGSVLALLCAVFRRKKED